MIEEKCCPKCGAEVEVHYPGDRTHYECESQTVHFGKGVFHESMQCLRRQLATATRERDTAREALSAIVDPSGVPGLAECDTCEDEANPNDAPDCLACVSALAYALAEAEEEIN